MGDFWAQSKIDAILGLPWLNTVPHTNMTTVTENFGVESFAVCIGRNGNWKAVGHSGTKIEVTTHGEAVATPSFMYWGSSGQWQSMVHIDILRHNHWSIPLRRVSVGGNGSGHLLDSRYGSEIACWDKPCVAVIDTGSSGLLAPSSHVFALYQRFGGVVADCSNYEKLPDIHFRLGGDGADDGMDVTLSPRDYVKRLRFGSVTSPDLFTESCRSQFAAATLQTYDSPVWVLGVPFLQEHVVEFDRSRSPARLGIGAHPGACPGPAVSAEAPAALSSQLAEPDKQQIASKSGRVVVRADVTTTTNPGAVDVNMELVTNPVVSDVFHLLGLEGTTSQLVGLSARQSNGSRTPGHHLSNGSRHLLNAPFNASTGL
jgi:hypothetical protein